MSEKPSSLVDVQAERRKARIEQVRRLFEDHPELAEEAIIVAPAYGVVMAPEGYSVTKTVGTLEIAKFSVMFGEAMAAMPGSD